MARMTTVFEDSTSVSERMALLVGAMKNYCYSSLLTCRLKIEVGGFEFHSPKRTPSVASSSLGVWMESALFA